MNDVKISKSSLKICFDSIKKFLLCNRTTLAHHCFTAERFVNNKMITLHQSVANVINALQSKIAIYCCTLLPCYVVTLFP